VRAERATIEIGQARALRGNAPFVPLLSAVRRSALPARLSRDAGSYLCNYAYWRALQHVRDNHPLVQFVHIPPTTVAPLSRLVIAGENVLVALLVASRRAQ
jgi:pyroglutamyl-peptidase